MNQRTLTAMNADPANPGHTYPARLAAAANAVEDLRSALEAAVELRDALIVGWVEAGASNRETARAAGLSEARVIAILART